MQEYENLPIEELPTLHRQIGALIAQRRQTLEQLKQQIALLGFSADELAPKKKRNGASNYYRDPENPDHTWSGRGEQPGWLWDKLEQGQSLENFVACNTWGSRFARLLFWARPFGSGSISLRSTESSSRPIE